MTVQVNGDVLDEANETYTLDLSNPSNATIADAQALGTITDDDAMPALSVNDATVTEGDAGNVTATFTVSLNAPSGRGVTVDVASANGTATSPADYTALPLTTLAFAAGETTKTVTVDVHGDVLDEFDETYTLALTNATNATIADNLGLGTITDDDALPTLSIDDVTVAEGNSGTVAATFTVGLSAPSGRSASADFATANGTATAPGDYTATSGALSFAAGETTKTITVLVNGDLFDELDETYAVNLTNVVNAAAPDPQGVGTINDDDGLPSVSVSDVTVTEGSGSSNAVFTLSLNAPSGQPVDVDYVTADGSATAPADYTALPLTTITFAPGQVTRTVSVPIAADLLDEIDESFTLNLSNAVNATISDPLGLGTITDNDPLPTLAVDDVTVLEGNSGTVAAIFTVTLNTVSGRSVSVDYATENNSAVSPADYAAAGGTLTFAAGQVSKQVTVMVNGEALDEANETYFLTLANPINATFADGQGVGTITDDDPVPALSIGDVTVTEGNAGTTDATFTVSLDAPSGRAVSAGYATAEGTATSAGRLRGFERNRQLRGRRDDQDDHGCRQRRPDRRDRRDVRGQRLRPGQRDDHRRRRRGHDQDDDAPPSLSVSDVSVTEGNGSAVSAVFTVSLSSASGKTVNVDHATADGTATAPADYAAGTGSLTFTPGQTSKTVTVIVAGDSLDEIDETFTLNLSNAVNATIGDGSGLGTILDNDALPIASVNDVTVTEGDTGTVDATFTVSLNTPSGRALRSTTRLRTTRPPHRRTTRR